MNCMCGRGEWCAWCTTEGSSCRSDEIYDRLNGTVRARNEKGIYYMPEFQALKLGYEILPMHLVGINPERYERFLISIAIKDEVIKFLMESKEIVPLTWIKKLIEERVDYLYRTMPNEPSK